MISNWSLPFNFIANTEQSFQTMFMGVSYYEKVVRREN